MHVTTLTNPCNASSLAQRPTWQKSWSWHDHVHIPALKSCHVANSEDLSKIYVPVNKRVRSYVPSVEVKKNCPASHHFGLLPWIGTRHLHLSHRLHSLQRQTGTTTLSKFPEKITLDEIVADLDTENEKKKNTKYRNAENQKRIDAEPELTERFRSLKLSIDILLDGDPKLDHKFN